MRGKLDQGIVIEEIRSSPLWGDFGGRGWEWVANWFLLGGVYLLWRRIISWHIPVSMLLALACGRASSGCSTPRPIPSRPSIFSAGRPSWAPSSSRPIRSAPAPPRPGQLIFGASIGLLVFVIRTWGGYPDAVAFAVLLMNIAAPTIDHYTQPRVFGHTRDRANR
jgi:Na+-translocating ferredoxin:NAD+ oxidoreductase subunit D